MAKITSFRIATGKVGIAALAKISAVAIAVTMLGMATSAQAGRLGQPCTTAPQNQWLSLEALQNKVEEVGFNVQNGFKVQKAKLKNGCAEFYVAAKTGERMELFVDPATGTIIGGQ